LIETAVESLLLSLLSPILYDTAVSINLASERFFFHQSHTTQRPSLFALISYCAIVFSFALMFANGWFTSCDDFYGASAS